MALTDVLTDVLAGLGIPPHLIREDTTIDALADECVLYPYLLLAAAERDAVEPLPEELVEASGCVGDFVHLAQLRRDQQASRR